jgi:hypothetical protein
MSTPKTAGYYLTKTIENKWCVAYWDEKKCRYYPNQYGSLKMGIRQDFIASWHELPDFKTSGKEESNTIDKLIEKLEATRYHNKWDNCQDGYDKGIDSAVEMIKEHFPSPSPVGKEERTMGERNARMLLRELWYLLEAKQEVGETFMNTVESFLNEKNETKQS